jgi:O-antigen ligase
MSIKKNIWLDTYHDSLFQLVLMTNCFLSFLQGYDKFFIYIAYAIIPISLVIWFLWRPWRNYRSSLLNNLQLMLLGVIFFTTLLHRDFGMWSAMTLSSFSLFFLSVAFQPREIEKRLLNFQRLCDWSLLCISCISLLSLIGGYILHLPGMVEGGRLFGVTISPNSLGGMCVFAVMLGAIALMVFGNTKWKKALICCSFFLNGYVLLLTKSRASQLALLVFLAGFALYCFCTRIRLARFIKVLVLIVLVVCLMVLVVWVFFSRGYSVEKISDGGSVFWILDKLSTGRVLLWQIGLKIVRGHVLFGISEQAVHEGLVALRGADISSLHNVFVDTLVHHGIFALALFLVIIGMSFYLCIKGLRVKGKIRDLTVMVGLLFISCLVTNLLETTILYSYFPSSYLFFICIGLFDSLRNAEGLLEHDAGN